jgi:hypothetical protein
MNKNNLYEERITLWSANTADEAIEMAEKEAMRYSKKNNIEFIGLSQLYHLFENRIRNGTEIVSLMREHNYSANKYIDRYFDTGFERQQNQG